MEFSILLAFGALICWAFGDFFIQKSARKIGDIEALAWIGIIATVILIPFIIFDVSNWYSLNNIVLLLGLGGLTFITSLFQFEALKEGKLSIIDIILEIELPVTIALSFIFLKETLNTVQAILIIFILAGMILIASQSFKSWKSKLERGAILALVSAVLMGGVNFLTGISSKNISPLMAVFGPTVVFTILCIAVIAKREGFPAFLKKGKDNVMLVVAMSLFDTAAWIFFAFAAFSNEISITTAITETYPALALFLGVFFNKERMLAHQYLGAVLALVCCVLLSLAA